MIYFKGYQKTPLNSKYYDFYVEHFHYFCTNYSNWDQCIVLSFSQNMKTEFIWLCNFLHKFTLMANLGKFMDNCWTITCQVMAYMKKVYFDLIIINL